MTITSKLHHISISTTTYIRRRQFDVEFREEFRNRLIFIDPAEIHEMLSPRILGSSNRKMTGGVVSSNVFSDATMPFSLSPKFRYCYAHWRLGMSWKESGALGYYQDLLAQSETVDKLRNLDDVLTRLQALDELYRRTASAKKLYTRYELGFTESIYDESGGIYVHFDGYGNPIFGGGGYHRLAIGKLLNLNTVPICIGIVHRNYETTLLRKLSSKGSNFIWIS